MHQYHLVVAVNVVEGKSTLATSVCCAYKSNYKSYSSLWPRQMTFSSSDSQPLLIIKMMKSLLWVCVHVLFNKTTKMRNCNPTHANKSDLTPETN